MGQDFLLKYGNEGEDPGNDKTEMVMIAIDLEVNKEKIHSAFYPTSSQGM